MDEFINMAQIRYPQNPMKKSSWFDLTSTIQPSVTHFLGEIWHGIVLRIKNNCSDSILLYFNISIVWGCGESWRGGRGDNQRGVLAELSTNEPIFLMRISNLAWKTLCGDRNNDTLIESMCL